MKSKVNQILSISIFVIAVTIFMTGRPIMAQESEPGTPMELRNKICPVTGEKIAEGKEAKMEYQEKIYNLCCAMCQKDFMKNPEAAIKRLDLAQGENVEADLKHADHDDHAEMEENDGDTDDEDEMEEMNAEDMESSSGDQMNMEGMGE